jgi:hypothetical protein
VLYVVLVLLIIFLIQFLVVLTALMLVVFLARPEVPFSGDSSLKATTTEDRHHFFACLRKWITSAIGKKASRSSRKPTKQVMVTLSSRNRSSMIQ